MAFQVVLNRVHINQLNYQSYVISAFLGGKIMPGDKMFNLWSCARFAVGDFGLFALFEEADAIHQKSENGRAEN